MFLMSSIFFFVRGKLMSLIFMCKRFCCVVFFLNRGELRLVVNAVDDRVFF